MGERRMFTQRITDSDAFTEMPLSAQCLYFHLNMHADDDGFLNNANKIRKSINASEDDLKLLMLKRFILPFENGVVVIKHWLMHNLIRKDRKQPTQYQEELAQLVLKDDNSYTEKYLYDNQMTTICQPNDNQMSAQDKLSKVKISKNNIIDTNVSCSNDTDKSNHFELKVDHLQQRFDSFWNAYPKKVGKQKCIDWFKKHKPSQELTNKMLATIEFWKKSEQWSKEKGQYIPQPYTWLNRGGWDDEAPTITPMTGTSKHNINDDWGTL